MVPFVAYLPVEHFGASGLVAAVTAGLVTGQAAPRYLAPQHRLAEEQNWRTIELLLEGGVFLLMGLELYGWSRTSATSTAGSASALWIGAAVATIVVAVRALYVMPLLWALHRRAGCASPPYAAQLAGWQTSLDEGAVPTRGRPQREPRDETRTRAARQHAERRTERFRVRIRRSMADIDYLAGAPLGWREGTVLVWAGMRGVVTLAAAQTLPRGHPAPVAADHDRVRGRGRDAGGAGRLAAQAGARARAHQHRPRRERTRTASSCSPSSPRPGCAVVDDPDLVRPDGAPYDPAVVARVRTTISVPTDAEGWQAARDHDAEYRTLRLIVIERMRETLLDARGDGTYDSETLEGALAVLDAEQISTEASGGPITARTHGWP